MWTGVLAQGDALYYSASWKGGGLGGMYGSCFYRVFGQVALSS